MKTIQVLMSTYNGEEYLREQLDSILNQDCNRFFDTRVTLLIRDDGSKDGTQNILTEYEEKYPEQVSWYQGDNIGVIASFFDLVQHAGETADYYALADQDDYWETGKLSRGIEILEQMDEDGKPHLYCCRPKLVDENLNPLISEIKRPPMRPSFENAIVENIVTGCTIVMNPVLRQMVRENPPQYTVMHDWWFYLVVSCFGKLYYDETPYICYRQHGGNTVGTNVSRWKELKDRLHRFKGNRGNISHQITEFLRIYEEAERLWQDNPEAKKRLELARELLDSKKSFWKRKRFLGQSGIYRQRKNDDRIFRLILLSGSF